MGRAIYTNSIKIKIIFLKVKNHLVEPRNCKISNANRSKFEKKWNETVASIGFAESFS